MISIFLFFFVCNLLVVLQIFEPFGRVELVQLPLDLETGQCKGFGFVQVSINMKLMVSKTVFFFIISYEYVSFFL